MKTLTFLILIGLGLAPLASPGLGAPLVSAGKVARVTGSLQALRNPSATPDGRERGASRAKFEGQYWDAHDLAQGSSVYFGDLLSASADGKTRLTLASGFELTLGPHAKVRLTRSLTGHKAPGATTVDLLGGFLRARSGPSGGGADETATDFRSRSLAMGVRGTDFTIATTPLETEVVVVEGAVAVRSVLTGDGPEVVLKRGEATVVTHPPPDLEARRSSLPEAEFRQLAAAYAPKPAAPASAAQVRRIQALSTGIVDASEQKVVDELLAEKTAAERPPQAPAPAPVPPPAPEVQDERRSLALELSVGYRSIRVDEGPKVKADGIEPRLGADYAPFDIPLSFGAAYARVSLEPTSAFDDADFDVERAVEDSFGAFARYEWEIGDAHAVLARLGIRSATLRLEGRSSASYDEHVEYSTGGLWIGLGYQYAVMDALAVALQFDLLPGSIEPKDQRPADRDLTQDPDGDAWGGTSVGIGVRFRPF